MTRRQLLIRSLFVLVVYAAMEVVSLAGLATLRRTRGLEYFPKGSKLTPEASAALDSFLVLGDGREIVLDSALGWRRHRRTEVNAAGIRDDREYDFEPSSNVLRISAFGDSFTYGSDVPLGQNWSKRISALAPHIEILNFGLGAFGLDQAYLRYRRQGAAYRPHIVFLGYMTENLARDVNVYRGFYGNSYRNFFFTKPRFTLRGDSLILIPNPLRTLADYRRLREHPEQILPELGRHDYHYVGEYEGNPLDFSPTVRLAKLVEAQLRRRAQIPTFTQDGRYNPRSEAYLLTLRIFDSFYRDVLADGGLPVIVVLPDLHDQRQSRDGRPRRYDPMLAYFRDRGYRYIDVIDAFKPVEKQYSLSDLTGEWGHFSQLGNDLVARHVLGKLKEFDIDDLSKAKAAAAAERRRADVAARVF